MDSLKKYAIIPYQVMNFQILASLTMVLLNIASVVIMGTSLWDVLTNYLQLVGEGGFWRRVHNMSASLIFQRLAGQLLT